MVRSSVLDARGYRGDLVKAYDHVRDGLSFSRGSGNRLTLPWILPVMVDIYEAKGELAARMLVRALMDDATTPERLRDGLSKREYSVAVRTANTAIDAFVEEISN